MADNKKYKVGITAKEPWDIDISYEALDYTLWRVEDGGDGCGYIALVPNIGVRPDSDPNTWVKGSERGQSIYDYCIEYGLFEGTEEEFAQTYTNAVNAANAAAQSASDTERSVEAAEALRVLAEGDRVAAENERVSAENDRSAAEAVRDHNESLRTSAEDSRAGAERYRESAESNRALAESSRVSAENDRNAAEADRERDTRAAITDANTARDQADAAAARANTAAAGTEELNNHPPRISTTTHCWEFWDAEHDVYVDSETMAMASPYATFEINTTTGELEETTDATYAGPTFELDTQNGNLQIEI